jgi:ferredoxin-NADP reductase
MQSITATYSHSYHSPSRNAAFVFFQVAQTFDFQEGQFVMIEAHIHWIKIKKPYSIATTSQQMQASKQIGFIVKKTWEGGMSEYLTQHIQETEEITITWPVGHYTNSLRHNTYLLISTGSGLSPNLSLYKHLVYECTDTNQVVNLYGEKDQNELIPEVIHLFTHHGRPNVSSVIHFSRDTSIPESSDIVLNDGIQFLSGRIQSSLPSIIKQIGTHVSCFVCGAPEMVEDVRHILHTLWIDKEDVTFEKY